MSTTMGGPVMDGSLHRLLTSLLRLPGAALRAWEAAHHKLAEVHRRSFMKRAKELGLSDYKLTEFAKAIRETKLLADVQKMLEEREPF